MMKYYLFVVAMCIAPFLFAQTEVVNSQERAGFSNGIAYSLPKTVFVIEIEAVKTIKLVGPYYRFSERYLGTKDVITENNTTWAVKAVKIREKAIPDPAHRYLIKPDMASAASFVTLTPQGLLYGINVPLQASKKMVHPQHATVAPDLTFSGAVLNEEALQANSVAKMAELSAKQIYRLRDSRMNLLTGDNDKLPDGKALELMLAGIDKSEKELTALFLGKTVEASAFLTYEVMPEKEMKSEVLFRLSNLGGVVSRDDLSGQPFYINVKDLSDRSFVARERSSQNGLYYRIPGQAEISIVDPQGNVISHKNVEVAQFGVLQSLPASIFNKSALKVRFNPETGSLLSVDK